MISKEFKKLSRSFLACELHNTGRELWASACQSPFWMSASQPSSSTELANELDLVGAEAHFKRFDLLVLGPPVTLVDNQNSELFHQMIFHPGMN